MTIRRLRLIAFLGSLLLAASVAGTFDALQAQHDAALVVDERGAIARVNAPVETLFDNNLDIKMKANE